MWHALPEVCIAKSGILEGIFRLHNVMQTHIRFAHCSRLEPDVLQQLLTVLHNEWPVTLLYNQEMLM